VYTADDTVAHQHKVMIGPRIKDKVVILNGLKPGQKIITDGFQRLKDGGKITTKAPQAQGAPGAAQGGKQAAK
jgi:multidrug efflux pump subunit AcrA (membrane-fusion protein)